LLVIINNYISDARTHERQINLHNPSNLKTRINKLCALLWSWNAIRN